MRSGRRSTARRRRRSSSRSACAAATCATIRRTASARRGASCGPSAGSSALNDGRTLHISRTLARCKAARFGVLRRARSLRLRTRPASLPRLLFAASPHDLQRARPLNDQQLAAVEATGEVFVSAGAGTGKTAVLVERFVRAVCERGLGIDNVLVITYTERAAGELRTRIRERLIELERHDLARDLDGGWISTIHGFCHRLLRAHPFAAGLDPRFRVLDESQSAVLRSEAFAEALARYVETGGPERVRLLATYGADGLRGMLTNVYDRLRSAGRPLELPGEPVSSLADRVAELREVSELTLRVTEESLPGRAQVEDALQLLDPVPAAEDLLDLSDLRVGGEERERFASFGEALAAVEQSSLDEIASRDRALLEEILGEFDAA